MRANGFSDGGDQDAVGHPGPVLRLRVQQGALRGLRPGLLLDGVPQGELPGRVHGRPAHQRPRRQGQVGALPQRVPPDGHQGAAARRQRVGRRTSPPVGTDIRFGLAAIRNVGAQRRRRDRRGHPRGEGPVHRLRRLPRQGRRGGLQQADHRVAGQGRRVRLARATRGAGWSRCTRTASTPASTLKRKEANGQFDLFARASATAAPTDDAVGGG